METNCREVNTNKIKMIEQTTTKRYYCDDCGDLISDKLEPNLYFFEAAKVGLMFCKRCKEKLKKIL